MAKFDFNNSRLAKFFGSQENTAYLQSFLDRKDVFFTNYGWYKTQGHNASFLTTTDNYGLATFNVKARKLKAAPMADLRAPLGDSNQMDKNGHKWYTASIPDFITPGYVETAVERYARIKQFEEFGDDADILADWSDEVQTRIDSVDATMNFMTAQLMSTGKIDYSGIGRGISTPLHKAIDPIEYGDNFINGGAKKWADPSATILTYMKEKEAKYRETRGGFDGALKWQMTRNTFYNVFLKNAEVRELVTNYRQLNNIASTKTMPISKEQFIQAFVDFEGVSPIEIVTEKERNLTHTTDEYKQGWSDNIVVLRPAGDACEFERTDSLDRKLIEYAGNKAISTVFGTTNDGLGLLMNSVVPNGKYMEWHTDIMFSACPALIDFPDHCIMDITKTD